MNRIDRLFAILLLLQRKRRVRAQDLAERFEVNERTIYRDMAALSESGVPLVALPGTGYELSEGYYLPPLLFTPSEASALFLGAHLLIAHTQGRLPKDAKRALDKISVILPKPLRTETERLREIIHFMTPPVRFDLDEPKLATLQGAIHERRVAWIRYHALNTNETTEREIEPHALAYGNGAWYVGAYCRLRQDERQFRLNRIEDLRLLNETFKQRHVPQGQRQPITARIQFKGDMVRWVHERQHYGFQSEEVTGDDVVMTFVVDTLDELKPWVLGWGANAVPLDPPELRQMIREEAIKWVELLTIEPNFAQAE